MIMMPIKPTTNIVKYMPHVSGIQALGWGIYGHVEKMY